MLLISEHMPRVVVFKMAESSTILTHTYLIHTKLHRANIHGWKQAWKCPCICAYNCVEIPVCTFAYVIIQKESVNCFSCVDIGHPLIALGQEILKSPLVYLGIMFLRGRRHRLYESGNIHPFFSKLNIHHSPTSWPLVTAWDLQAVRGSFIFKDWP